MSTPIAVNGSVLGDMVGAKRYVRVPCIAGTTASDAVPALLVVQQGGYYARVNLPSGTTPLQLTHFGCLITSTSSGNTVLTLRKHASLGFTPPTDGSFDPWFAYQRCGDGKLFINPEDSAVQKIVWNDLDPQYFTKYGQRAALLYCGIDPSDGKQTWCAT